MAVRCRDVKGDDRKWKNGAEQETGISFMYYSPEVWLCPVATFALPSFNVWRAYLKAVLPPLSVSLSDLPQEKRFTAFLIPIGRSFRPQKLFI